MLEVRKITADSRAKFIKVIGTLKLVGGFIYTIVVGLSVQNMLAVVFGRL